MDSDWERGNTDTRYHRPLPSYSLAFSPLSISLFHLLSGCRALLSLPSHAARSTLIPATSFRLIPRLSLDPPPFSIRVIRSLPGETRREDDHLSIMEGSHAEPVRQAPDPDAMALVPDARPPSHASQDPLQAAESPIAYFVHFDAADLLLARRYSSFAPGASVDDV